MSEPEPVSLHDERDAVPGLVDVRTGLVPIQFDVACADDVATRLGIIGRTEDVAVSSGGNRLAIAGFNANLIAIVDFEVSLQARAGVALNSVEFVRSPELSRPHGVSFLDEEHLLVANRESELLLVHVGARGGSNCQAPPTKVLVDGNARVPVRTPGSVVVRHITNVLSEVMVCNNYAHDVTRYVLDRSDGWRVVDAERLLAAGLDIPDGIAVSSSGDWIAISNHNRNSVYLYRYDEHLRPESPPDGILTGPNYPHGLRFAADDRWLLVADAGLPYVHAFEAGDGDWTGERGPAATTRVMDDASFNRARYNPQEGGVKGLTVAGKDMVVVTSECQPLGFFTLESIVGEPMVRRIHRDGDVRGTRGRTADASTQTVARLVRRAEQVTADLLAEQERTEQLTDAVNDLTAQISQLGEQLVAVEARAVEARAVEDERAKAVQAEAQRATEALDGAEVRYAEARADSIAASAHVGHLDAVVEDLQAQVDLLRSSTSWRVTAPLRWLSGITSGSRRHVEGR